MPLAHISEKRLAANRANAQKSTGPRTEKGKATVAENGCRTRAYARVHRMPPQIEAHFRARAEEKTKDIADPDRRALHLEWWMLDGHQILHDRREIALFRAGLAYAKGDEQIAKDWVLRQSGYIQALNRYAGWIHARTREIEKALWAKPEEMEAELEASLNSSPRPLNQTKPEPNTGINVSESTGSTPSATQTQRNLADQTHSPVSQTDSPAPPQPVVQPAKPAPYPTIDPTPGIQAPQQPQTQQDLADQTHSEVPGCTKEFQEGEPPAQPPRHVPHPVCSADTSAPHGPSPCRPLPLTSGHPPNAPSRPSSIRFTVDSGVGRQSNFEGQNARASKVDFPPNKEPSYKGLDARSCH